MVATLQGWNGTVPSLLYDEAVSERTPPSASKRPPAGAALPSERVTAAIHAAALAELAEVGYGSLRMEAVARRAGVGKAALYRRWSSKLELVQEVLRSAAVPPAELPDRGSLRADIAGFLEEARELLGRPEAARLLSDLTAEALRTPPLADLLDEAIGTPRRDRAEGLIARAVARGEVRPGIDVELALDLVPAPLHWRLVMRRRPLGDGELVQLTEAIVAALRAL